MRHFRSILIPAVLFLLPGYASAGWVQQPSGTTAGLHTVYFINPQTGWVAGDSGFVLRTTDGGASWNRNSVDTLIWSCRSLWFQDATRGWAVGSGGRFSGLLYITTDGGVSWQLEKKDSLGITFLDVEFTAPQKGWLVCCVLFSGDGGMGVLYQTTNGGGSWSLKDSSSRYLYCDVAFADSLFGWVTTDNHGVFIQSSGYLRQTTDGGATWQTVNQSSNAYGRLRFADRNMAWLSWNYFFPNVARTWGIQRTTNRGANWTNIFNGYGVFDPVDSLAGWALKRDTLFHTQDGGTGWSWQIPPGRYLNELFFTDSLTGWIVGDRGLILHTTDGGSGVWEVPFRLTPYVSGFMVSPNPFTSYARVSRHATDHFVLFDIAGRRVGTYRGDRIGEGLRAGVYFVRAESGNGKPVRVVKMR